MPLCHIPTVPVQILFGNLAFPVGTQEPVERVEVSGHVLLLWPLTFGICTAAPYMSPFRWALSTRPSHRSTREQTTHTYTCMQYNIQLHKSRPNSQLLRSTPTWAQICSGPSLSRESVYYLNTIEVDLSSALATHPTGCAATILSCMPWPSYAPVSRNVDQGRSSSRARRWVCICQYLLLRLVEAESREPDWLD